MSESVTGASFEAGEAEAPRATRRIASERIMIINAVQSVVGAYLSPVQVEDVATAVLSELRREP